MRNELLHAYVIHYRKYRERSYIVHTFSEEYGRVDGILRQNPPPQYQPIQLLATGKHELKNFSHVENFHQPIFLTGDAFFLGFYLNEIILKLAPVEQEMPLSFGQYQQAVQALQHLVHFDDIAQQTLQILRQFEHCLLQDLGYLPDFSCDAQQQEIVANLHYDYHLNQGFSLSTKGQYLGQDILLMQQECEIFSSAQLKFLTKLYRQILNALLGDKPLKSRQLWIQHKK